MILVIGDTSEQLATWTVNKFGSGQLADNSNYKLLDDKVYFTGLGDLTTDQIKTVALSASEVYFVDTLPWADQEAYLSTLVLCNHINHFVTVKNLNINQFRYINAVTCDRPVPVLWAFGGSVVAGVGLDNPDSDSVATKLAGLLGVDLINCSEPGTGMRRSFECLIHSNIRRDDYVLLDVAPLGRLRFNVDNKVQDVLQKNLDKLTLLSITDDQLFYDYVSYLDAFVKFCQVAGVKLIFYGIAPQDSLFHKCKLHFSQYKEFMLGGFPDIDIGTDGFHPGVKSHKIMSDNLFSYFKKLYD